MRGLAVDGDPRVAARADRPIKLGEIDENAGLESPVPHQVRGLFGRLAAPSPQPAPQIASQRKLARGDEAVQILTYFVTPEGEPWQTNVQTVP